MSMWWLLLSSMCHLIWWVYVSLNFSVSSDFALLWSRSRETSLSLSGHCCGSAKGFCFRCRSNLDRTSLTMMFFHSRDSMVHCNCSDLVEIVDLMAARFDQRVMICCKFLHFSPAIGFSRQLLAYSAALASVSALGSSEWNEVNFHRNRSQATVFESANNREMKYGMSIH